MARYDDLNTSTLGYLTFMSVILLTITVLLLQAMTFNWIDWQEESKWTKQSYGSSDAALQAQKDSLSKYESVEVEVPLEQPPKETGAATTTKETRNRIPINRAEAILLEQLKTSSSKTATPNT